MAADMDVSVRCFGVDGGERKWDDSGSFRHFCFSELPVHGFGRSPWNGEFLGYLGPHLCFESG